MKSKGWYAWINSMPPGLNTFHVVGDVYVGNPGIQAELAFRVPQGINPAILLLDLHLVQRPGMWVQKMTWVQARYDRVLVPRSERYKRVEVFLNDQPIAKMDVHEVS